MIDHEPIQKQTHRYRELLQSGILISEFTGTYDIKQDKWRLDFILTRPINSTNLKELLTSYVESEYEGTDCEFYKSKRNPESIGCVKFYRGDL